MNYTFHPHAEKELEEIEKHYDDISPDWEIDFAKRLKLRFREF